MFVSKIEIMDVKDTILDETFWKKVEELAEILDPVVATIAEIKEDDFGIEKSYLKMKRMVRRVTKALKLSSLPIDEKKLLFLLQLRERVGSGGAEPTSGRQKSVVRGGRQERREQQRGLKQRKGGARQGRGGGRQRRGGGRQRRVGKMKYQFSQILRASPLLFTHFVFTLGIKPFIHILSLADCYTFLCII